MSHKKMYTILTIMSFALGCSVPNRKVSRIKQAAPVNQSVAPVPSNQHEPVDVAAKSEGKENFLKISEEVLKAKIEAKAELTRKAATISVSNLDVADVVSSPDKAVVIAKEQIAVAFDSNLKANPDAMSKEDADYLKEKLNTFIEKSAAGNNKEASVAWNQFAKRVEEIRLVPKKADPWVEKKTADGKVVIIVDQKPRAGILTSLIRLADQVIDTGADLVTALFGQPVVVISSSAKSLVDQVFVFVI